MNRVKRQALLILFSVAILVLAIIVFVRNTKDVTIELLAAIGIVAGLAIAVVSLPVNGNGKDK